MKERQKVAAEYYALLPGGSGILDFQNYFLTLRITHGIFQNKTGLLVIG